MVAAIEDGRTWSEAEENAAIERAKRKGEEPAATPAAMEIDSPAPALSAPPESNGAANGNGMLTPPPGSHPNSRAGSRASSPTPNPSKRVSTRAAATAVKKDEIGDKEVKMIQEVSGVYEPLYETFAPTSTNPWGKPSTFTKSAGFDETVDEDALCDSEIMDSRQQLLNYCIKGANQFDQVRRAKSTTMMILYQLHNPDAAKFLSLCGACYQEINHGTRHHCRDCADFDLCQSCYEPVVTGLWAKQDARFAHPTNHRFTHIDMERDDEPDRKSRAKYERGGASAKKGVWSVPPPFSRSSARGSERAPTLHPWSSGPERAPFPSSLPPHPSFCARPPQVHREDQGALHARHDLHGAGRHLQQQDVLLADEGPHRPRALVPRQGRREAVQAVHQVPHLRRHARQDVHRERVGVQGALLLREEGEVQEAAEAADKHG
jgi:hypothetical protein